MALTAKKVYAILKRQISDMEAKLNSPVRYRGTVATADLLPLNPDIGDMYNIESKSVYGEAGMNVAWNGVVWDTMGAPIDMSLYIKSSELADWVKQQNKPTYTAEEVGALPDTTVIPSKTSDLQNDSGFLTKIPDNYLSGTDKTLSVSGQAADAKTVGDKNVELLVNILSKLDKNQGSENFGKIAGINESGDIVPMFPVSVDYNEETNCLEFGSDQKMELNKGINLDSTLTKTGYAADAGAVGEITNSLKESISNKITKFYASSQGETHLADSDDGLIQNMFIYGKSEQKWYSGKNLLKATLQTTTQNGVTCTNNGDGTYTLNGTATERTEFIIDVFNIDISKKYKLIAFTKERNYINCFVQLNQSPWTIYGTSTDSQVTITDSENIRLVIAVIKNNTLSNEIIKPMIVDAEKYPDATYDDFEPYTGGIPSPNPAYPQEIKSVVNPTVKVCGKNLLKPLNKFPELSTASGLTLSLENSGFRLKGTAQNDGNFRLINPAFKVMVMNYANATLSLETDGYYDGNLVVADASNSEWIILSKIRTHEHQNFSCISSKIGVYITFVKGTAYDVMLYPQIELGSTATSYEPYHEQTVTLPYTLNAIPVSSGGNVTIGGQEYVSDYFGVERGKLVRMCKELVIKNATFTITIGTYSRIAIYNILPNRNITNRSMCSHSINKDGFTLDESHWYIYNGTLWLFLPTTEVHDQDSLDAWLENNDVKILVTNEVPEEIDLTPEEIQALKALATYYPTTNISINSEQLDGYTVFNYPISMANGWNYVKKQLNDNRDYIYDMDIQSAEAYVNSEYAVALTELEV